MAEWLGDTPIFQATMTERERREFALFKTKVKATSNEEDTMATKKNAAQTTINENVNEQEDTMTENAAINAESIAIEGVAFKLTKKGGWYHNRAVDIERHAAIRDAAKLGRVKGIEPTTCIPNETVFNITTDEDEIALLGKACKKFGWENGVCTPSKASKNHGRPNPEYKGHGWLVWFKQEFYKTGERAGQPKERGCTIAYPMEAFVWETESGLPEFDTEKKAIADARKAQRVLKRAKDDAKAADDAAGIKRTTSRRKTTSRKPAEKQVIKDEPTAASLPNEYLTTINALMEQNQQLIAALAAAVQSR